MEKKEKKTYRSVGREAEQKTRRKGNQNLLLRLFFYRSPSVTQLAQERKKGGDLSDPLIFSHYRRRSEIPALFRVHFEAAVVTSVYHPLPCNTMLPTKTLPLLSIIPSPATQVLATSFKPPSYNPTPQTPANVPLKHTKHPPSSPCHPEIFATYVLHKQQPKQQTIT